MLALRFGLIGKSLGHSFSASYFNGKFKELGQPHRYDLFEFSSVEEVRSSLSLIPDLRGLNVTIPFKEAILPWLDSLDPFAEAIGAVNTIRIINGHWRGYNTDAEGFSLTMQDAFAESWPQAAIVLGNGGASRAVRHVLQTAGINVAVYARNPVLGENNLGLLLPGIVRDTRLIVQTTPVGMYPGINESLAFPFEALGPQHTVIDLIYNPEHTRFMLQAHAHGARTVNGLRMLYGQAEAAWKIWNEE